MESNVSGIIEPEIKQAPVTQELCVHRYIEYYLHWTAEDLRYLAI